MNGRVYVQRIHMRAFGKFIDKTIGPLSPGLNIVYGSNEAGKSTARAFVEGVLFGWPRETPGRNAYKPRVAEREGSLFFCDSMTGEVAEFARARNANGIIADAAWEHRVMGDIDKTTFDVLFSLDADELSGLSDAPDIASRLLTAASGTETGPADVLAKIDERIASYTSRAASATHSFVNLKREADECREQLARARAEADALKSEDRELHELEDRRANLAVTAAELDARAEATQACKAELAALDARETQATSELARARADLAEAEAASAAALAPFEGVPDVSEAEQRRLQDTVDRLSDQERAFASDVDAARAMWEAAQVRCQAQDSEEDEAHRGAAHAAALVTGVAVAALVAAAVVLLVFGAQSQGVALFAGAAIAFVCALVLVGTSIARAAHARGEVAAEAAERAAAATAAEQAAAVLSSRQHAAAAAAEQAAAVLSAEGFPPEQTTPAAAARALSLSHEARLVRARHAEAVLSARRRVEALTSELEQAAARRHAACEAAGFPDDVSLAEVEAAAAELAQRRTALAGQAQDIDARCGELRQMLRAGMRATELDELKMQRAQIATRENESAKELMRLIAARDMLDAAMHAWSEESQPVVYAQASKLLSMMTKETWTGVRADDEEGLLAVSAVGTAFPPHLLSSGTRQQLYLALRIALLECVKDVGACIPVLADDMLVNFDDARRDGAARALFELSRQRQVIVFTCHKEVLDTFSSFLKAPSVLAL